MFEQKCIEVKYDPSPAQVPGQAHFDGNCTFAKIAAARKFAVHSPSSLSLLPSQAVATNSQPAD